MEGVTIFPTRLWLHLASEPAAMTTPFLRVTAAEPGRTLPFGFVPELAELRGVLPYELTPQLIGSDLDQVERAATLLPPTPVVELNCGCPSPSCVGRFAGSGLLREPPVFGQTVRRLAGALGPGRLAVKMRLGVESPDELEALVAQLADVPLARLTVHGRTRRDGYRGAARWDRIETAARAVGVPTIASGDVLGVATADALARTAPTTAGLMIGRGALRNPWVFEELRRGAPVRLTASALAHALLAFALLHEAWMTQPVKLLARVGSGRLTSTAPGTDEDAWREVVAGLATLVCGVPRVLTRGDRDPWPVSPTAFGRLRFLWTYLRTGLPPAFAGPGLAKARRLEDFLAAFGEAAAPGELVELGHQAGWDEDFRSARGA